MPLSDRKAGATNYPLNKILKIRFALVVCSISIFSLNNSDNLKGRAFCLLVNFTFLFERFISFILFGLFWFLNTRLYMGNPKNSFFKISSCEVFGILLQAVKFLM
jgi:hypothetical protein